MASRLKRLKEKVEGILSLGVGLYLGLCLYSYNPWDPSFFTTTSRAPSNLGGVVGAYIADLFVGTFGHVTFLLPLGFLVYSIRRFVSMPKRRYVLLGYLVLLPLGSLVEAIMRETLTLRFVEDLRAGMVGESLAGFVIKGLSAEGAYILSLSLFFSALMVVTDVSFSGVFRLPKIKARPKKEELENIFETPEAEEPEIDFKIRYPSEKDRSGKPQKRASGDFPVVPIDFLKKHDGDEIPSEDEMRERADVLEQKLADYKVRGRVTQVFPGPVVTMYEFEPEPGVKLSKIISLTDDLGRALGGVSVRISPIPGKTEIGIEVPNKHQATVSLRDIIDSDVFRKSKSLLTIALGKDIYGRAVVGDLIKMPHLLIAGTTGSGKSVMLNSIIISILYKATPRDVKMLLIDPKLLELSRYEGIPHLFAPVMTNPKDATVALKKMVLEMERRYKLIAEQGARNIETFNAQVPEEEKLPYIVVIIDELADLMFTASKEVENSIVRLAQMARASGIHLIVATQRPSVDVITGIIKANFPTRIAFQVSSRVDSRTILDVHGAEQLIGRGDMLLMRPGSRLTRLHGPYVSEEEIADIVDFVKAQGEPDYSYFWSIEEPQDEPDTSAPEGETSDEDLYQKVIEYGRQAGEISISSIQRRFKIGFNRAARIMDRLEQEGLVGPPKGAGKPRDFIG
ncbi:MAG: DNA translocase FtsK [Nitrospirae bacterium]|nr:MAG: DNA translocase FtsK [Nitrospirota bacterium]